MSHLPSKDKAQAVFEREIDRAEHQWKSWEARATVAEAALSEMRAELDRVKAALEPFAAACPKLFNDWCPDETPAWFVDDEDGEPGWEKPSSVTVGDFRAAARALSEGETP